MTNAPFDDLQETYKHKLNFDWFVPTRWWFLKMFIWGKEGSSYWFDGKYKGIIMYREEKKP